MKYTGSYRENDILYLVKAEVNWTLFLNQPAYLSITGEVKGIENGKTIYEACGMCHEDIQKAIPSLEPLLKWHLVNWPGIPLHYIENASYWLEFFYGISKWSDNQGIIPLRAFKNTVVFGAVKSDSESNIPSIPYQSKKASIEVKREALKLQVTLWCENRLEELIAAFHEDLKKFNVDIQPAIEHHSKLAWKL